MLKTIENEEDESNLQDGKKSAGFDLPLSGGRLFKEVAQDILYINTYAHNDTNI